MDCIFCKIINNEIPSYKIYEDETVLAFLDTACDAEGHTLVVPKKHYFDLLDVDKDTLNHLIEVIQRISNHFVTNCGYDGVNIMNATRKEAQQSVFHLHFHIIPRKKDDGLNTWPNFKKQDLNLLKISNNLKIN